MPIVIDIVPPASGRARGLAALVVVHRDCQGVPMVKHRNPLTDQITWQCVCGLTLRLPGSGPAATAIEQVARDGQPALLPPGAFACSVEGAVEVGLAESDA